MSPLSSRSLQLSIVVPTYNEKGNVSELVSRLGRVLNGIEWEVIFVDDDSPDQTHSLVKEIAQTDSKVRCIRRIGRRGLAGACIEGMLSSSAPVVAVMDADLQHDEEILPRMLSEISSGAELVVGSRYVDGGTSTEGLTAVRQWGSSFATSLARKFLKTRISDPMSGFFMMRRDKFEEVAPHLSKDGFKLLLDITASASTPLRTVEVPFTFKMRVEGESKLDTLVTVDYLGLLLSKITGGLLPVRFFLFMAVGASGVAVHLAALSLVLWYFAPGFSYAQFSATMIAMTWNYVLNNQLTFRDRRLKGAAFIRGMFSFYAACSIGTIANVGTATWFFGLEQGPILAGLAGALLGAVFNYAATSLFTWKK